MNETLSLKLDELRAHGGLIEMNLSVLGHVIFLGYNEREDYRPYDFGKFRVGWLINNELYFLDANSKYLKFIKSDDWDWNKAEIAPKFKETFRRASEHEKAIHIHVDPGTRQACQNPSS